MYVGLGEWGFLLHTWISSMSDEFWFEDFRNKNKIKWNEGAVLYWEWKCRDEAGKYKTSLTSGDSKTREFVPHFEPVGLIGRPLVQLGPHKYQDKKPELSLTRRRPAWSQRTFSLVFVHPTRYRFKNGSEEASPDSEVCKDWGQRTNWSQNKVPPCGWTIVMDHTALHPL